MSSKSVSQIFKTLFQTVDINFFVLHGVFFIRYVQLKSLLLSKKVSGGNFRKVFVKVHHRQKFELCKVINGEKLH